MYLTTVNQGGRRYLRLMQCVYDAESKTWKKKIVKSYGNVDKFMKAHPAEYQELMDKYNVREKTKEEQQAGLKRLMTQTLEDSPALVETDGLPTLNLSWLMLKRLWDNDLDLYHHFRYLNSLRHTPVEYDVCAVSGFLTMLKLTHPMSHFSAYKNGDNFLGTPLGGIGLSQLYRCLRFLSDNKDQIMTHVRRRVTQMFGSKFSLLFYDCTNCYFETPYNDAQQALHRALRYLCSKLLEENKLSASLNREQMVEIIKRDYAEELDARIAYELDYQPPLRMQGPSKEERRDLPIVSIALVIDENAIPIDFEMFPGNTSEKAFMQVAINKLREKYPIENAMVVADSAINSLTNLKLLREMGLGYAVAQSVKMLSKEMQDKITDLSEYTAVTDEQGNPTGMAYRVFDDYVKKGQVRDDTPEQNLVPHEENVKLLVTFSEARRLHDLAMIDNNVTKASAAVAANESLMPHPYGHKGYINTEVSVTSLKARSLKQSTIDKHRRLAGFTAIIYKEPPNMSEEKAAEYFTPERVHGLYHKLVRIEECFRIMKSNFSIRPMFVRNRKSVKGHITVCVLALMIQRIIEKRIEDAKLPHLTPNMIAQGFNEADVAVYQTKTGVNFVKLRKNHTQTNTSGHKNGLEPNRTKVLNQVLGASKFSNITTLEEIRKAYGLRSLRLTREQEQNMTESSHL